MATVYLWIWVVAQARWQPLVPPPMKPYPMTASQCAAFVRLAHSVASMRHLLLACSSTEPPAPQ